ncbi:hypothetical protein PoB_000040900 [Plakobranchus ocellatus]|uniref:Uncharacterized protein n=1 Tax=Plakobranchus ocellatus TaxID=259542 RepID=A0AAV3XRL8_9GAST|nr:hypothetical protein PoB_000040900 [Plakobranchus ocellatus]
MYQTAEDLDITKDPYSILRFLSNKTPQGRVRKDFVLPAISRGHIHGFCLFSCMYLGLGQKDLTSAILLPGSQELRKGIDTLQFS